jgi:phosphoenolpyruvate-protein kinase (PTS system EI component)
VIRRRARRRGGGTLSHAAIVARESGIPAIIGAAGATSLTTGDTVEVDPLAGVIRMV